MDTTELLSSFGAVAARSLQIDVALTFTCARKPQHYTNHVTSVDVSMSQVAVSLSGLVVPYEIVFDKHFCFRPTVLDYRLGQKL